MYQTTSHDEVFKKHGVQGTGWQTGACAACAGIMFVKNMIPEKGVLAPERIPPQPFLDLMNARGVPESSSIRMNPTVSSSGSVGMCDGFSHSMVTLPSGFTIRRLCAM